MEAAPSVLRSFEGSREYATLRIENNQESVIEEPEDPLGSSESLGFEGGDEPFDGVPAQPEHEAAQSEQEGSEEADSLARPVMGVGAEALRMTVSLPGDEIAEETEERTDQVGQFASSSFAPVVSEEPEASIFLPEETPAVVYAPASSQEEIPMPHTSVAAVGEEPVSKQEVPASPVAQAEAHASAPQLELPEEDTPKRPAHVNAAEEKPTAAEEGEPQKSPAASEQAPVAKVEAAGEDEAKKKPEAKKTEAAKKSAAPEGGKPENSEPPRTVKNTAKTEEASAPAPSPIERVVPVIIEVPAGTSSPSPVAAESAVPSTAPEALHTVELRRDITVQEVVVFVKRQVEQTIAVARSKPRAAAVEAVAKRVVSRPAAPRPAAVIYKTAPAPARTATGSHGAGAAGTLAAQAARLAESQAESQLDTVEGLIDDLMGKLDKQAAYDPDTYDTLHRLRKRIAALQDLARALRLHLGRRAITAIRIPVPMMVY